MQFHYFVDTTDLRLKEGFGGERRPKDRVKTGCLYGYLYQLMFFQLFRFFLQIMFSANLLCMYGNRMHKTLDLGFFWSLHPNSRLTNFQVLENYLYFPPTSPTSWFFVPIKFSLCSHQVDNGFPNMFQLGPHFVPYALPKFILLELGANIGLICLRWILLYLGESPKFGQLSRMGKWKRLIQNSILNLKCTMNKFLMIILSMEFYQVWLMKRPRSLAIWWFRFKNNLIL